jgi:uncharacterized membrane protein YfcA
VTLPVALLLVCAGLLIGAVGIGGFLIVPILVLLTGVPTSQAVVLAAMCFALLGVVAVGVRSRSADTPVAVYMPFLLAAAVGALSGVAIVGALTNGALTWLIAAAFAVAALAEWLGWPRAVGARPISRARGLVLGALTGAGSAMTGTSGPMVAMPLLAHAGVPTRERIGIAQVAQLPIAVTASIAFLSLGRVPWLLALQVALATTAGFVAGIFWSRSLPQQLLRRTAAVLMLLAAVSMVAANLSR